MPSAKARYEILVAEDNPADVGLVREALLEHRIECALHVVADGAQAIAFIHALDADPKAPRLDLLIVDMHLPKRDGEDILKSLRSTERHAQVPVVVMTGSDSPSVEQKAAKHAALSYFRKPPSLEGFLQLGLIIRRILTGEKEEGVIQVRDRERGTV
jgi:CheY-like chemotaxis protein